MMFLLIIINDDIANSELASLPGDQSLSDTVPCVGWLYDGQDDMLGQAHSS